MFARIRLMIEDFALLAVLLIVFRTWVLQGFVEPCEVSSGSMAETLLGPHARLRCAQCGREITLGIDQASLARRVACPNCNALFELQPPVDVYHGDRVVLDKSVFQLRDPKRWEVAAFTRPGHRDELAVKRIVGLPGETVEIRRGELWINGQIVRKTLPQQRALGVLVYDALAESQAEIFAQWRPSSTSSAWSADRGRLRHPLDDADPDWLTYVHSRPSPHAGEATEEWPITDDLPYNQLLPRRAEEVRWVRDVRVALRLGECAGSGDLRLRLTDGERTFEARLAPAARTLHVLLNGSEWTDKSARLPQAMAGRLVEVSLVDSQFLVAVDGRVLTTVEFPPSVGPLLRVTRPAALAVQKLRIGIDELRLFRDVYYTSPPIPIGRWAIGRPYQLLANEFFMLGDNSDISEDSRVWQDSPTVSRDQMVGKPLIVIYPSGCIRWGTWTIGVPDLRQIRYIR